MKRCLLCLQELPLFGGLDRPEFACVCLSASKKRIAKGHYLFHQGDTACSVYLVKAGKLKLVQVTDGGREAILDVVGPGEVLGETALFQDRAQLFGAIALQETLLCCFDRQQLETLIQQHPHLAVKIISHLGQKLYETMQQVGEAAGIPVRERLLQVLLRLADKHGQRSANTTVIELEITQEDLANMVGASRVMVAQVLKELRVAGIVDRQGKYYVLRPDPCVEHVFLKNWAPATAPCEDGVPVAAK